MKLIKQIAALTAAALGFAVFDVSVYGIFTKRYINSTSVQMQAKSVEVDKYLPFREDSAIVKADSSLKLGGDLPVVDGAAAIFPVYSAFVNATYPEDSVHYSDGDFTADSAMQYTNTRGAYKSLADGRADIIFCAKPSEEQREYAEQKGVDMELVPIGREAFVFLVSADNPVDDLSVDEVRGIYSGKYKNWSQLGGDNRPIDALQRNEGSGSQTAMLSFMGDAPMKRNIWCLNGSAIGFSFRYYVEGIVANGGVKMLSLNGVYPDREHISDGSYPVIGELYAVYDRNNDNENISLMIDWILSDEGQRIVEQSGYVRVD